MIAVAVGEPLLDELGELALERLVDEPLELGAVRVDELPDPLVDRDLIAHRREPTTRAPRCQSGRESGDRTGDRTIRAFLAAAARPTCHFKPFPRHQ